MKDLKELFDEIATCPRPPSTPSASILATARRAERRYRRRVVAGGVVAAVLAVVVASAAISPWAQTVAPTEPGGISSGDPRGPAVVTPLEGPVTGAADVLDVIAAMLPDGFGIKRDPTGADFRTEDVRDPADRSTSGARIFGADAVVYDGPRAGEMHVRVLDLSTADNPARRTRVPQAVLCAPRLAGECTETTVDGVTVMVTADYRLPDHPTVRCASAERAVPGAAVSVGICQGVTTFFPHPKPDALAAPIFTTEQLAALAADEVFLG
jgi:hypothetical protein